MYIISFLKFLKEPLFACNAIPEQRWMFLLLLFSPLKRLLTTLTVPLLNNWYGILFYFKYNYSVHKISLVDIFLFHCSFVRSKLEYSSLIWSHQYLCHVKNIEKIQRRFLRNLNPKTELGYRERRLDYRSLFNKFNFDRNRLSWSFEPRFNNRDNIPFEREPV